MWIVIALGWLLTVVALFGNGLVIYVIATKVQLHTKANWFVLSLAVADFCVGLTQIPLQTVCSAVPCRWDFLTMFQWFFVYASVSNLCAMTLDRYTAIVKPFTYLLCMQRKQMVLLVCCAWVLPLTVCFLPVTFIYTNKAQTGMKYFSIVPPILFEIIPCLVLLVATGKILYIAKRHARQTAIMLNQLRCNHLIDTNAARSQRSAARGSVSVVTAVVVLFIFCYAVAVYITFCDIFRLCVRPQALDYIQPLLLVLNSSGNPLAYGLFKKDIKKEFKHLFCHGDE